MKTFILMLITLFLPATIYAAMTYGNGTYTNMCGTGTSATSNQCNQGCNPGSGSCSANNNRVVRYVCDGRQSECRSNESSFGNSYSVNDISCGKTVQIDVFSKTCRVNGAWTCGDKDLKDYMVFYTGDCAKPTSKPKKTPTPTRTPTPTAKVQNSSCDNLTIISGNDSYVPANVTIRAQGSDNLGNIKKYRFYFGDGQMSETTDSQVQHQYQSSGTYTAIANVQDSRDNWKGSSSCQKTVNVKSLPVIQNIESHKSDCSNVIITSGNYTVAPTDANFTVTGYDNKGAIKKYKIDYGDGSSQESDGSTFSKHYDKPGTYVIRGYINDNDGNWKGGENACRVSLSINTAVMTQQPNTGTPTLFTVFGLGSGFVGLGLLKLRRLIA